MKIEVEWIPVSEGFPEDTEFPHKKLILTQLWPNGQMVKRLYPKECTGKVSSDIKTLQK